MHDDATTPPRTRRGYCTATTARGTPCKAHPALNTDRCLAHQVEGSEGHALHRAASATGGKLAKIVRPSAPPVLGVGEHAPDLTTGAGVRDALAGTLGRLLALPIDPQTAHAVAAVAGHLTRSIETAELEARLAALETIRKPRLAG
jgi:hypothetical protein